MESIEFKLTDREVAEANEFFKDHKNCCYDIYGKEFFSTTGGEFSFIITPTGLGNCVSIRCNSCGEIKDITDIEDW